MKFLWALCVVLIVSPFKSGAQTRFVSEEIENLFKLIPDDCRAILRADGNTPHTFTKFCLLEKNNNLVFKVENNVLTHIGLHIFRMEEKKFYPDEVFHFIERFFLQLTLSNNYNEFQKRNSDNDIHLIINNRSFNASQFFNKGSLLQLVTGIGNTKNLYKDSLLYVFSVSDDFLDVQLKFPVNNAIVKGMDKLELDRYLEHMLKSYTADLLSGPVINQIRREDLIPVGNSELFYLQGETYHQEITSDLFFSSNNDTLNLVFDKQYPTQSFSNLFLTGFMKTDVMLNLSHIQYGGSRSIFSITLSNFVSYFRDTGYQLFFGIEKSDPGILEGTLLLYNPFFNSIGLLHIKTKEEKLFSQAGNIDARLFSNIPSDNIKDLFGIYDGYGKPLHYDKYE